MRRHAALVLAVGCLAPLAPVGPAGAAPAASAPLAVGFRVGGASATTAAGDSGPLRASAARATVPTRTANARIGSVLKKRSTSKVLGSRFTMTVWDTASDSWVYQRRPTASLRGASTTKILTAVGVLSTLGPEHRLATTVRAGASPNEIVLVAGGDPLLTSANLRELARATAAALGPAPSSPAPSVPAPTSPAPSDTATTPAPMSPAPSDSATSVPPTDPASPAAPSTQPAPAPDPSVTAAVRAARVSASTTRIVVRTDDSLFSGSGRSAGWPASYLPREVRPVGAFARDDRRVRDATGDAGAYFAAALRTLGVPATYAGEATASPTSPTLAAIPGHTVAQAVSRMLLVSDNDTAEMLFRLTAIGRGLPGTWAGARTALQAALAELDVPLTGVRIVDGSGLSLDGRLTAPALTAALARGLSPAHPGLSGLRGWLPVAGRTGTLRAGDRRFNSAPAKCAAGHVQAKTGTVADAIALAGYAQGADGQTKVFVSIVNGRPTRYTRMQTRQAVDRVVASVTGCW